MSVCRGSGEVNYMSVGDGVGGGGLGEGSHFETYSRVYISSKICKSSFLAHLSTKCSWSAIVISQCLSSVVRRVSCVVNNLF